MSLTINKQTYTYKKVGKCRIQADVYRADGGNNQPAILWIHGGALICGSRSSIMPYQVKRYIDAGFAVVSIDYRLAPETKLRLIIEDLKDAVKWVHNKGLKLFAIDPDRIAVIGHSAGGYLALMAGFVTNPLPKAIVSFYGYGDIIGPWYSQPDPWYCNQGTIEASKANASIGKLPLAESDCQERINFYVYCRQNGLWPKKVAGQDPLKNPGWFSKFCPIQNVTDHYAPTLLIHGDQDTDVPWEQSLNMDAALEQHQVNHKLLILSGKGHGFDTAANAEADPAISNLFDQVVDFLNQHL